MPQKGIRVLGPYPNGVNFRLVVIDGAKRKSITATSQEEVQRLKGMLEGELQTRHSRTVEEALTEYIEHRVQEHGIVDLTRRELRRLTEGFLPASASLSSITPDEAGHLYRQLTERKTGRGTAMSPGTHHVMLRRARGFFRWTVDKGYLAQNPFERIKTIGQSRTGKTQLTIDEARRFRELALKQATVWFKVQALCNAAGVPRVCSHSLRGLHSTLALEAGATPHLVAAALGHSSFRITARHYAEPSTLLNTRSHRVAGALGASSSATPGEPAGSLPRPADLSALIETLTAEQRHQLQRLLSNASDRAPK